MRKKSKRKVENFDRRWGKGHKDARNVHRAEFVIVGFLSTWKHAVKRCSRRNCAFWASSGARERAARTLPSAVGDSVQAPLLVRRRDSRSRYPSKQRGGRPERSVKQHPVQHLSTPASPQSSRTRGSIHELPSPYDVVFRVLFRTSCLVSSQLPEKG